MRRPLSMTALPPSLMKLLLDQGLPRSSAAQLRQAGYDTEHAGEVGLSTALDSEILSYARRENRVIVTLDSDFHSLLALSGATSPSVIRIRIEGLNAKALTELLQLIVPPNDADLKRGAVLTVQSGRVRARYLPLIAGK